MSCHVTLHQVVDLMKSGGLIGKSVKVFRPNDSPLFCDVVATRMDASRPEEGRFAASSAGPWLPICCIVKIYK